jgi:hypothetical protein
LRGCLTVLILAAAFVVGAVWFGGPPIAATVVEASLTGSGFASDELNVTVRAEPPLLLGLGRADSVEIVATGVRWNGLRAGSMTMRLDGVDLLGRTATTADGEFRDVEMAIAGGDSAIVGITIAGPADHAHTTIVIDGTTVNRIALDAFEREYGSRPESAELVAPDRISLRFGGNALSGTLRVEADGALVVATPLGTARLVEPNLAIPFHLTGVSVGAAGMELSGTTDLESLLG